jgi:hypothetical protein
MISDAWSKAEKKPLRPIGERWPMWSEMDGTGKFVTVMFWIFVVLAVGNLIS